jgi:hypothetical protein
MITDKTPRFGKPLEVRIWGQRASGVFQAEVVVDCMMEFLLAAQITLGRLNRGVAEEELDLLQFSTRQMTQPGAGATIMPHAA